MKYEIDKDNVEHGCCWDVAITRKPIDDESGAYGLGKYVMVCECNEEKAPHIQKALEEYTERTGIII